MDNKMSPRTFSPNLILIGMPSAGKSTLGVLAAKALGMDFLDTDILLQSLQGEKLQSLLGLHGLDAFLQMEEAAVLSLDKENTVIATGGSVVYAPLAMHHLQTLGRIVYLHVSFEELQRRLGNASNRGIAIREGQTLQDLYRERCPLYERYAQVTVRHEPGQDMHRMLMRLLEAVCVP